MPYLVAYLVIFPPSSKSPPNETRVWYWICSDNMSSQCIVVVCRQTMCRQTMCRHSVSSGGCGHRIAVPQCVVRVRVKVIPKLRPFDSFVSQALGTLNITIILHPCKSEGQVLRGLLQKTKFYEVLWFTWFYRAQPFFPINAEFDLNPI